MGRSVRLAALVAVLLLAAAVVGVAQGDLGKKFGPARTATLNGAAEVPAGDPNGAGKALFRFDVHEGLVCFSISIKGVDPMIAAHIHRAAAGLAGPVILPLPAPVKVGTSLFASKGCVSASRSLIRDILAHPDQYYYNTHNAKFPSGVVRGQLSK